ncbi:MAG: RNA methyltransferase [Chitinophagaceae bacterium]|nr:MAG: RNA methyltransferase [Chitinophagaceae bacterium]
MFSKSTVKYIQSLQHKKFRDEEGRFIAEGPKAVAELLDGGIFACTHIYAIPGWLDKMPRSFKPPAYPETALIKDFELEKISSLSTPNQVLAVFEKKPVNIEPNMLGKKTLVLDDIQDPGNLGTIIRIADWFGIENIVCSLQTADMYNPKVVQSTMASLQRVNIIYTELEGWLSKQSIRKYAAALNGRSLDDMGSTVESILIIGNESKGISEAVMNLADEKLTIPRIGAAESLNAGVATGILLYGLK